MTKRLREDPSQTIEGDIDPDLEEAICLDIGRQLQATSETLQLENELKRIHVERNALQSQISALRGQLSVLDVELRRVAGELHNVEKAQRNTVLASKLKELQNQHELQALVRHICVILGECRGRGVYAYSATTKRRWTLILNRNDDVVLRVDERGDVLTPSGKAKHFNVFHVSYDDVCLKVKQLVWQ